MQFRRLDSRMPARNTNNRKPVLFLAWDYLPFEFQLLLVELAFWSDQHRLGRIEIRHRFELRHSNGLTASRLNQRMLTWRMELRQSRRTSKNLFGSWSTVLILQTNRDGELLNGGRQNAFDSEKEARVTNQNPSFEEAVTRLCFRNNNREQWPIQTEGCW